MEESKRYWFFFKKVNTNHVRKLFQRHSVPLELILGIYAQRILGFRPRGGSPYWKENVICDEVNFYTIVT